MTLLHPQPVIHRVRRLANAASSAGEARKTVRAVLAEAGVDAWPTDLLTSELVANAVRHAGTSMSLRIRVNQGSIIVAVADGSPEPPRRRALAVDAPGGRGLLVVDRLSARWGWEIQPGGGKIVWFEVAAEPGPEDDATA